MPLGEIIGAPVAALFSGIAQNKATKKTNATNLQIARENNALQQKIAAENNQLQVDMMRENNKFSRDMAIEMFNLENDYNNPSAQVKRLVEAGLNPATMYGSGSVANTGDISTPSSAGTTVSPSMPSFITPTMQTPPSILGAMFGSLESVTRSLTNLSQAGLNKEQQVKISSLLTAELDKMLAEKDNIEISNQVKKFTFELDKVFSYLERAGKLNETYNNAYKLYNDGLLSLVKQDTEKAEQAFKDAQTALSKNQSRQVEEMLPLLVKTQEETVNLVREQQNTEKSVQALNTASSRKTNTEADFLDESFETRINQIAADLESKKLDNEKVVRLMYYYVDEARLRNELTEEQKKHIDTLIKLADREHSAYYWKMVLNLGSNLLGGGILFKLLKP